MSTYENRPPMGSRKGGAGKNWYSEDSAIRLWGQPVRTLRSAVGQHTAGVIRRPDTGGYNFTRFFWLSRGHIVKCPPGLALEVGVLAELKAFSTPPPLLVFAEQDKGTVYEAALADFERFGVRLERRFGPQIVLPLAYWHINGQPPTAKAARPPEPDDPDDLFWPDDLPEPDDPPEPAAVQRELWPF